MLAEQLISTHPLKTTVSTSRALYQLKNSRLTLFFNEVNKTFQIFTKVGLK